MQTVEIYISDLNLKKNLANSEFVEMKWPGAKTMGNRTVKKGSFSTSLSSLSESYFITKPYKFRLSSFKRKYGAFIPSQSVEQFDEVRHSDNILPFKNGGYGISLDESGPFSPTPFPFIESTNF